MENLNAEQILKALECCVKSECNKCPLRDGRCANGEMGRLSLEIIHSQEQKIFELENRLKECENGYEGTLHLERCKLNDAEEKIKELDVDLKAMRGAANSYKIHIVELTEENARLEKLCALRDQDCKGTQDLLYKAEAENDKLHASCTELGRKCASLNDENERLRAENAKYEAENHAELTSG